MTSRENYNVCIFPAHTSPIDKLLKRLDRVRRVGAQQWMACCPAHDDKSPSLSIKECVDGTVLVKCWAGCLAADVVAAVDLTMRDLFPRTKQQGRYPSAVADDSVIEAILIVKMANAQERKGKALSEDEKQQRRAARHLLARRLG